MTAYEFMVEALRLVVPVAISYIGVLKTRTELDILYAKQRGGAEKMRRRWYTPMFYKHKEVRNVASLDSSIAVASHREGVPGEVPVGPGVEGASGGGSPGVGGKD